MTQKQKSSVHSDIVHLPRVQSIDTIQSDRRSLEFDWDVDLTLMVACYNEEENVAATLDTVFAAVDEVSYSYEVLVFDDASSDRTVEIVREYQRQHPNRPIDLVCNEVNQGLAQCYVEGAFHGRGQYYRLICGDNVEPKETLVTVFSHVGQADLIIPYQIECVGKRLHRRLLSGAFTRLVNTITGYRIKYYNGLAVFRRYDVMRWHTDYRGFGFQADMITRMLDNNAKHLEIPVVARERSNGESTALTLLNLLSVAHMLLDLAIRRFGRILYSRL